MSWIYTLPIATAMRRLVRCFKWRSVNYLAHQAMRQFVFTEVPNRTISGACKTKWPQQALITCVGRMLPKPPGLGWRSAHDSPQKKVAPVRTEDFAGTERATVLRL